MSPGPGGSSDSGVLPSLSLSKGDITATAAPSPLYCTLKFSLINCFDHISDILEELSFHALLLCDGLVVAHCPLKTVTSGFVHRHIPANEGTCVRTFLT